ncbi:hypothetical protein CK203_083894 [Vitis vinifera]|uniref:Uncharacterized protein n=1 Tax=Vitis vinifera TaxID=29760 RepID=A0A438BUA6_VITVI|nr:hypothetical protein CK203_083894 [Vitis vinifera]
MVQRQECSRNFVNSCGIRLHCEASLVGSPTMAIGEGGGLVLERSKRCSLSIMPDRRREIKVGSDFASSSNAWKDMSVVEKQDDGGSQLGVKEGFKGVTPCKDEGPLRMALVDVTMEEEVVESLRSSKVGVQVNGFGDDREGVVFSKEWSNSSLTFLNKWLGMEGASIGVLMVRSQVMGIFLGLGAKEAKWVAQLVRVDTAKCGLSKWYMVLSSNPVVDDTLNLPGIVADSSAYDQSKRLRTGGDYTHTGYSSPSPFHPPPAPVWGPHGYMAPAPPPYDPYGAYPVPPVPMPAPAPVPAPSSYVPVQNDLSQDLAFGQVVGQNEGPSVM